MNAYEKIEKIIEAVAPIVCLCKQALGVPTVGTFKETNMDIVRGYSEATLNSLLAELKEIIETKEESLR